ncbi:aryl hydrocarbon receptor 2 [Heterodontus francisci]|uniref:aryl hydrocarbon receptor 2 n=1 Tax=Heterodontus francisci TaxID=7792 RepID=UPI00355C5BDE
MLSAGGIYAVKKRKKPVQKSPKPPPVHGVKSNPSKRHRDRLNCELDKLTSLLPFGEDVRARLDKLSVLRLSVGYLKAKSFFNASIKKNRAGWLANKPMNFRGNGQQNVQPMLSEGDLLLEALNGFILVVTAEGYVFYTSPTIQDYLGFHQSDVVHQSVFDLIHTDDRALFRRQLHWALNPPACQESNPPTDSIPENRSLCSNVVTYNPHDLPPENSSFMERNFICRFRCLLDNSSGFLMLNFQGRLKFLHGQNKKAEDGAPIPPQLALFAVATPLQPPSILEVRTKTLIFQTKHKLDFTPLACDTKGKFVLGYTETELCMRGTGYQFIHAADMMYCADNHVRMIKTGESGMTVFRLLTKQSSWVWVQANARLVYRGGRPDSIICKQRPLINEEGEEHLRKRSMQLPFNFATGEAVLYDRNLLLLGHLDPFEMTGKGSKIKKVSTGANATDQKNGIDPSSLLGVLMNQNPSVYASHCESKFNLDDAFANDFAVVNVPGDFWQPANNGKNSSKSEEINLDQDDPLSTIMDILSQKNADENDLCDTLENLDVDVENTDLEQWEETLMKMDNTSIPDDLNDILTTDFILSCVEDMLTKDSPKANKFPEKSLDTMEVNLMGPGQQNPFGSIQQEPFVFNTQDSAMPGFQNSIASDHRNSMVTGPQTPMVTGPQTPIVTGPQTPMVTGPQTPMVTGPQTPIVTGPQTPMVTGPQTPMVTGPQTPMVTAAQNPVLLAPQDRIVSGPQNTMPFGLQNTRMPRPQNETQPGIQNPLGSFSLNPLGKSMCNLSNPQSPISCSLQKQCRSAPQNMSCAEQVNMQQVHMGKMSALQSVQRNLQQSMLQKPQYLGLNGQLKVQPLNTPQQQVPQWQLQVLQNGQQVPTQPYQVQDCLHHQMPQSSCRSTQASQDRVSTACYLDQYNSDQLPYSCSVTVQQRTTVNQIPLGLSPSTGSSCMFASCEYDNCAPLVRTGLSFPDSNSITPLPPYSKIKVSPNHSPLQATCYYEKDPVNSVMGSSVIPNGEMNIYHSSCQFEPNFSPLPNAENSACRFPTGQAPWNYNDQFKGEALN